MERTMTEIGIEQVFAKPRRSVQVVRHSISPPLVGEQVPGYTGDVLWWQPLEIGTHDGERGLILHTPDEPYERWPMLLNLIPYSAAFSLSRPIMVSPAYFCPTSVIASIYHEKWFRWDVRQCQSYVVALWESALVEQRVRSSC